MMAARTFNRDTGWENLEPGRRYKVVLAFEIDDPSGAEPLSRAGRFMGFASRRGQPLTLLFELSGGRRQQFAVTVVREVMELD